MPFPFDKQSEDGRSDNPLVTCVCGREVNLDMMQDVRPVKETLKTDEDYVCDSCMEHFYRNGILTREEFYRAHDAPADLIVIHAVRDAALRATSDLRSAEQRPEAEEL